MQVRLLRDWKRFYRGRILCPGDGVANVLIRRGIAEEVKPAKKPKRKK